MACASCHRNNAAHQCAQCQRVAYCDAACQRRHWTEAHWQSCLGHGVSLDTLVRDWNTFFKQQLFVGNNEASAVPRRGITLFHGTLSNTSVRYGPLDIADRGSAYFSITPGHPYHVLLEKARRLFRRTDLVLIHPRALVSDGRVTPLPLAQLRLQLARAEGSVRLFEYLVTGDIPAEYGRTGHAPYAERLLKFPTADPMAHYLTPVRTFLLDPVEVLVHALAADKWGHGGETMEDSTSFVEFEDVTFRDPGAPWAQTTWDDDPALTALLAQAHWQLHVLETIHTADDRLVLYALLRAAGAGNAVVATHVASLFAGKDRTGGEFVFWVEDKAAEPTLFEPFIDTFNEIAEEGITTLTSWPAVAAFGRCRVGKVVDRVAHRFGLVDTEDQATGLWVQCLALLRPDPDDAVTDELLRAVAEQYAPRLAHLLPCVVILPYYLARTTLPKLAAWAADARYRIVFMPDPGATPLDAAREAHTTLQAARAAMLRGWEERLGLDEGVFQRGDRDELTALSTAVHQELTTTEQRTYMNILWNALDKYRAWLGLQTATDVVERLAVERELDDIVAKNVHGKRFADTSATSDRAKRQRLQGHV